MNTLWDQQYKKKNNKNNKALSEMNGGHQASLNSLQIYYKFLWAHKWLLRMKMALITVLLGKNKTADCVFLLLFVIYLTSFFGLFSLSLTKPIAKA